ncbi:GNAT family N-acetyltransferase [Variovorax sp. HJSM1_2]|uniref:GNAT family N-acetyltransferase n=1 Tax=Variovorax sp. HJSM1_2 TaxID=3366263 RepID=UPI003BECA9F1
MTKPEHIFRHATPTDVDRCFHIETTSYQGDEAATREKIATRIAQYPQGFLVLEVQGVIAGFINSGCTFEVQMADEAFKELIGHNPAGPQVVIMSVVVHPDYQGQGWSSLLMRHFVAQMHECSKEAIHLMCRTQHVALYQKMGYRYVRPSDSAHGGMAWHEMVMPLTL